MGLFDNIRLAADLVKGGIAAFKASEKLDKLVERSRDECKALITPEQERLYQAYRAAADAREAETDTDKTEAVEAAQVAYLTAIEADASFPKDFRAEITLALKEFAETNDAAMDIVSKHMMRQAKTDEEKAFVQQMMEEVKADNS